MTQTFRAAVILFAVSAFLGLKLLRFQTLAYSFNDLYAFLQMASSWVDGRPFMYDNVWGFHHRIHNYYTVLLWGPLAYAFGAYGLFAVQVILLAVSYVFVNARLSRTAAPRWALNGLLALLLLGPVALWLNDHPNIGWHTELTYLPLALLFAVALAGRSRAGTVLAGLGIVLVKEDGAVLAGLIHLSWLGMQFLREHPTQPVTGLLAQKRFWQVAVGWAVVFGVGMAWLSYKNQGGEPRLQMALTLLGEHVGTGAFWRQMLTLVGQMGLLLLPVLGLLGLLTRRMPGHRAVGLATLFGTGILILTALNFVQSAHYYGQPLFYLVALTWPPRFVLLWAFSAAFLTFVLAAFAPDVRPLPTVTAWVVLGALYVVQVPLLYLARPDVPQLAEIKNLLRGRPAPDKKPALLQPADLAVIRCVAEHLPARSSVLAFDYVVPYFHRHYGIWPTGNHYRRADVAVLPIRDRQGLARTAAMPDNPVVFTLNAYRIYARPAYVPVIRACLATRSRLIRR